MNDSSLIPQDYVSERREIRRTGLGVLLFLVVMSGVVAAFLVTNRQWESVRVRQRAVAAEFAEVSEKITHMEELKVARDDLVQRAELAAALVSRVPRSILIDGLVERMPPRLRNTGPRSRATTHRRTGCGREVRHPPRCVTGAACRSMARRFPRPTSPPSP